MRVQNKSCPFKVAHALFNFVAKVKYNFADFQPTFLLLQCQ